MTSSFVFYKIIECAIECVSESISVSSTFPWYLFLLFVLFYSNLFVFILSYYIVFYYHPLYAICFLRRDRKRVNLSRTGMGETRRNRGRGDCNQNIMYEKQLFPIKEKIMS